MTEPMESDGGVANNSEFQFADGSKPDSVDQIEDFFKKFPYQLPEQLKEMIRSKEIDPEMVTMEELETLSGEKNPVQKKNLGRRFIALIQLELRRLGGVCIVMPWGETEWIEPASTARQAPDELFTLTHKDVGDLEEEQ